MANKTKAPRNAGILALMLLAGAVFGGLVMYVKMAPADKVPADVRRQERPDPTQRPTTADQGEQVAVWIPTAQGEDVAFRSERVSVPKGESPMVYSVNRFLEASKIVDPGARLLSVDVKDHFADLYFNAAFNATVGSSDEGTLLKGLRLTFGQFADVEKLRFFADGQPMETLGNVDLSEGIDVLKPGDPAR